MIKKRYKTPMAKFHKLNASVILADVSNPSPVPTTYGVNYLDDAEDGEQL